MALYLNVSQPMGGALNWSEGERLDEMDGIFAELIRQINFIVSNLGADNVIEAASVKAENIDTKNAKIVNAQIKNLTASKIKAGTLDLSKEITISDSKDLTKGNSMTINKNGIVIKGKSNDGKVINRFVLMPDGDGNYLFAMYDKDGDMSLAMDDDGNAAFRGTVESSEIYSSHIVGVEKSRYDALETPDEGEYDNIFVDIGHKGIKILQEKTDSTGKKIGAQKWGATVDSDMGTSYLILGEGNGDGIATYNGVKLGDDMFVISKWVGATTLELRGMNSSIQMMQDELNFSASRIRINHSDYVASQNWVNGKIEELKDWVRENYQPIGS